MRYLALACDYDGTLALHGRVDSETVSAIERVAASGRRLIMVTGRLLDDLLEVFDRPDLFEWIVAENGALLYQPSTKEERLLGPPIEPGFFNDLKRRGVKPLSRGRIIVSTWEPHENTALETIRDHGLELQVIFNKGAVMVLPAGMNKASGLSAALEAMGLSAHNVAGIGDAENDHAFLSLCEFAAAVQNALPVVKDRADYVTKFDHGAGVAEVAEAILTDDLKEMSASITRHLLPIGKSDNGEFLELQPFGRSLLLAGTSGSGKSTLAKVFLEQLAGRGYQFCIIDPEGDYEEFEEGVVLGNEKRAPRIEEAVQLLEKPAQNAVVNLLGITIDDRPAFFAKLLSALLEMRARTGRPHWIVVDEAHHLMPVGWEPAALALPQQLFGMVLITVHPNLVSPSVLKLLDTIATVGETPGEMIRAFAEITVSPRPETPPGGLPTGEALIWSREEQHKVRRFRINQTRLQHSRHKRKYAEGDLGPHSFYFTGPERKLNLKAQNLFLFLQTGEGVDDETWLYHLERGDYESWFRDAIKNEELASEAKAIAASGAGPQEGRDRLREAVERHYTLPAPHRPAPEVADPEKEATPVSARPTAAGNNHRAMRRQSVDPVQMLKQDHQKVQQLFQQFDQAKDSPQRMKTLSDQAIMELQIHSMIEEELFYPAMRRGEETEDILNEAEEEHHVVDLLIEEVLRMKPTDKNYHAKFTVLAENVKHHIREEEGEMLPKAPQLIGARLQTLGDQMMQRKEKLMMEFGGKPKSMTKPGARATSSTRTAASRTRTGTRAKAGTSARSGTRASTARSGTGAKAGTSTRSRARSSATASKSRSK